MNIYDSSRPASVIAGYMRAVAPNIFPYGDYVVLKKPNFEAPSMNRFLAVGIIEIIYLILL